MILKFEFIELHESRRVYDCVEAAIKRKWSASHFCFAEGLRKQAGAARSGASLQELEARRLNPGRDWRGTAASNRQPVSEQAEPGSCRISRKCPTSSVECAQQVGTWIIGKVARPKKAIVDTEGLNNSRLSVSEVVSAR